MSLVIDASVALAWSFEDERTPEILAVLEDVIEGGAIVPALWRLEMANSLRSAVRRGRVTLEFRDDTLADLDGLSIAIDHETNTYAWSSIVVLSDTHALTPYDAAYLDLASRKGVPLATLDKRLRQAALSMGIAVRNLEA